MTPIEFHTGFSPTVKKKFHEGKEPEEFHIYDCPFCGKAQHLYFFPSTTTWDCKVCGKKGNVHIFNRFIYNDVCTKQVEGLREHWQLPTRVFKEVKYNPLNSTWVIPTFRNGKLNNLYKTALMGGKLRVLGTPGLPASMLNWADDTYETVWLCEGQKDKYAGDAIIGTKEIEVVGIPGANMFREGWATAFQGKDVVLCYDNDESGANGAQRVIDIFKKSPFKPKRIRRLKWDDSYPEKFDLYDLYQKEKGRAFSITQSLIEDVIEEEATSVTADVVIADDSCDTYQKALTVFGDTYYITRDMKSCLSMVLASIFSTNLEGEQVWVKVIGRPGCGKSTISKAISASDFVQNMSTFTGLFSGWKDADEGDPSLVPLIANRTLVVKDADALMKQGNIEKIMSELRDFYDKDSTVRYGNRQQYNYQNVKSTFVMMGTQVLRRQDQSFLGERLLSIEMDVTEADEDEIKERVLQNSIRSALGTSGPSSDQVMASMKGFIEHLKERSAESVSIPEEFQKMIVRLCSLAAMMRTQVDRDMKRKLLSPAVTEVPTRLIGQMINTAVSLCVVYGVDNPDEEITYIVKKVLRDTVNPRSHRFLICDILLDNPGFRASDILELAERESLPLNKTVISHELEDLEELQFVEIKPVPGKTPGYKARGYWLKEKIRQPFQEITE